VASYSGSTETTEYIGGLLEKMTNSSGTSYRYYVPSPGGNNFVVYNRWVGGSDLLYYVTEDHLGSTATIIDQTGALVVSEKFAAPGWNENTAQQEATMATVTRHEYTGQEGLDNAGLWLVNLNGRLYNPSGMMMFSPDPIISDLTDTRSYNRYAYVNYNPLRYIDPTGFYLECYLTGLPPGPLDDSDVNQSLDTVIATATYTGQFTLCIDNGIDLTGSDVEGIDLSVPGGHAVGTQIPLPQINFPQPCGSDDAGNGDSTTQAAGNAAAAASVSSDSAQSAIDQAIAATLRAGRPLLANTGTLDPSLYSGPQYANVYAWRAAQAVSSIALRGGVITFGTLGTGIDAFSAFQNFDSGQPVQGSLDTVSAASGLALLLSASSAPVAIPTLAAVKGLQFEAALSLKMHCTYGVPFSSMNGPPM
jgi:RHS repeat-associated protein